MSQIKQATIGTTTYNIVQASAVKQKSLLLLIGGKIALNSRAGNVNEIDTDLLVGALLTMPEPQFDQISNITLHQVVVDGDTNAARVTIDDFQGRQVEYFHLVAEGIKANLQDFFTWLDTANADARKAAMAGSPAA